MGSQEIYSIVVMATSVIAITLSLFAFINATKLRKIQEKESVLKFHNDRVELNKSFRKSINILTDDLNKLLSEKQINNKLIEKPYYVFISINIHISDNKYVTTFINEFNYNFDFLLGGLLEAKENSFSEQTVKIIKGFLYWLYERKQQSTIAYISDCLLLKETPKKPDFGEPDSIL